VKLSCTRENLYQGLSIVSRISTKNVNLPILNNVLFQADSGGLTLSSTNLELAISCHIRAKVDQEGDYTIPSKLFFDYVNLLPNERVDMDLIDAALRVSCGSSKTKLKGMPASEFPPIPPAQGNQTYSVSVSEFQKALGEILFAAATNESRPELAGIYLAFHHPGTGGGTLVVAATDSYRLGECIVTVSGGSDESMEVIVPQRTLSEVNRILSVFKDDVNASPSVEINVSESQIVFRYGTAEVTSRVIEGKYPNYRQIIPTATKTQAVIDRGEFVKAIKTASLFSRQGLYDVRLMLSSTDGSVRLLAVDSTRGENEEEIPAEVIGDDNVITLNYRYLLDGVNAMKGDKIQLEVTDGSSPCLLRPVGMPDERYQYVVMPIRQ
jgi:DNA polymerase III subunit beta